MFFHEWFVYVGDYAYEGEDFFTALEAFFEAEALMSGEFEPTYHIESVIHLDGDFIIVHKERVLH